jgi:hypothetical protein
LIKSYGQRVSLKKIDKDYVPGAELEQCDISMIEDTTLGSPVKKYKLDDTVDMEFRLLAMKEEDMNDTALDLYDILHYK